MPCRAHYSTCAFPLVLILFLSIVGLGFAASDVTSAPSQRSAPSASTKANAPSTTHTITSKTRSPQKATTTIVVRTSTATIAQSARQSDTCLSASINYITNRLPQQCWTGSASSTSTAPRENETAGRSTPAGIPAGSDQSRSSQDNSSTSNPALSSTGTPNSGAESAIIHQSSDTETSTTVQSSATVAAASAEASQGETDAESLLDQAEFLSFEEWKKKKINLEKLEQNAGRPGEEGRKVGRQDQQPGINDALDSLGDDGEIYLDLSSFGGSNRPGESPPPPSQQQQQPQPPAGWAVPNPADSAVDANPDSPPRLSKDAGKTCKERSNYASLDCAAGVLKTNPKCKSASSILVENKDSYMLNQCSEDNKFLIVELCENIIIDTVVLSNFEFFSSMFRTFRISVSDRYPVKPDKWVDLGTFEARNSRDIQPFLIKACPIFAKYLRVEFLTHYGNEYYCPVSLLRVHGTTMYEDWRRHNQGRDADEEEDLAASELTQDGEQVAPAIEAIKSDPSDSYDASENSKDKKAISESAQAASSQPSARQSVPDDPSSSPTPALDTCNDGPEARDGPIVITGPENCPTDASPTSTESKAASSLTKESIAPNPQTFSSSNTSVSATPTNPPPTTIAAVVANSSSVISPQVASSNNTVESATPSPQENAKSANLSSSATTLSATLKPAQASFAPTPYQPPTQESFFKSIHKRLSFLETNSTLSLQYIESQSALLRDAFAKVEKRQINKTSSFLESLNATITAELRHFKNEYDRLWQSAVMELASQREESKRERDLLGERVRLLAEEMGNQKRLMAVQATLMLLCLGLVVFGKVGGSGAAAVDSSLLHGMQEIVAKAKEAKLGESDKRKSQWRWESPWSSPSRRSKSSPDTTRSPEVFDKTEFDDDGHALGIVRTETSGSSYEEPESGNAGNSSSAEIQALKHTELTKHRSAPTTPDGKG